MTRRGRHRCVILNRIENRSLVERAPNGGSASRAPSAPIPPENTLKLAINSQNFCNYPDHFFYSDGGFGRLRGFFYPDAGYRRHICLILLPFICSGRTHIIGQMYSMRYYSNISTICMWYNDNTLQVTPCHRLQVFFVFRQELSWLLELSCRYSYLT